MTSKGGPRFERLLAVFPLLAVALFPRAFFGLGSFFHYDTWMQNLTFRAWWFEQLRAGHFATWCPGMFAGFPLFAETQTGPLYPPTFLLFSTLPATLAFSWSVVLHFAFAGVGAFVLARRLGAGRAAAVFAGVAFELSGFLVTHVVHFNLLTGAAWTPWIAFLAVGIGDGRRRDAVWLAMGVAAMFLGAHPYATLMNLGLAAAIVLGRTLPLMGGSVRALATFAGAVAVGALTAAVQILPTRDFLARTTRGEAVDWSFLTFGSFPPWNLFTLAAPDLYGTPVRASFWGGPDWSHFAETCAFVGLVTVALAVVAIVLRRDRTTFLLTLIGAGSALLMLGRFTPAYRVLTWLPLFESTRLPGRFALPATLAVVLLAALGLDALLRAAGSRRSRVALGVAGAVVVVLAVGAWWEGGLARSPDPELMSTGRAWSEQMVRVQDSARSASMRLVVSAAATLALLAGFARTRWPQTWAAVAVVLVAAELFTWGRSFNPTLDPDALTARPPVVEALPAASRRPRVFRQGVDEQWTRQRAQPRTDLMTPGWQGHEAEYRSGAWTLPPNSQLLYGVDSGEGFTSLLPLAWLEWMGLATQPGAAPRPNLTEAQADLLAIDAVLSTGAGIGGDAWESTSLPGDVWLSRNLDPMPRVRLATSWRTVPDRDALLQTIRQSDYDPRVEVLLESAPSGSATSAVGGRTDEALPARETAPGRWEVDVPAGRVGVVVLAESYDPDWIARTANGTEVPVVRADGLFLAFIAPTEGGTVVLRHAPASVRTGALLSGMGLLLCVVGVWMTRRDGPDLRAAVRNDERRNHTRNERSATGSSTAWSVATLSVLLLVGVTIGISWRLDVGEWSAERERSSLPAAAVRAWTGEAGAAFSAGAWDGAARLLRAAAARTPGSAEIYYRLGLVEQRGDHPAAARAAFEQALAVDPNFEPARQALREMKSRL